MHSGPGHVVGGKYRLMQLLGTGGMGAVWRAEHTALRQQVAVKLLDARGPTAERAVQRFLREGQIAAAVRHRNVVYISDFGTENGTPYLVMELLDGAPLADCLFTGETFKLKRFLDLMIGCLDGLGAVHAAGIIHRDIKPENIFLVSEGDSEFPKVLDFGLSRSTDGNDMTGQITREGLILGTPEYISPEQARGSKSLDRRADLDSLGGLVYEGLAGRIPFEAENSADLIAKVLREPFVPVHVHRPDVGQALSDFVSRAMARDREERFASAEDMRAALEEAMAKTPRLDSLTLPPTYGGISGSPHYTSAIVGDHVDVPISIAPGGLRSDFPTVSDEPGPSNSILRLPFNGPPRWAWPVIGAAAATLALVVGWGLLSRGDRARGEPPVAAEAAHADETPAAPPPALEVPPEPAAAEPTPLRVELTGMPAGAQVSLDGAEVEGPVLMLAPGSGTHHIEVSAPGYRTWRIEHAADRDGTYEVVLRRRSRRAKKPRASGTSGRKRNLVRDLDF